MVKRDTPNFVLRYPWGIRAFLRFVREDFSLMIEHSFFHGCYHHVCLRVLISLLPKFLPFLQSLTSHLFNKTKTKTKPKTSFPWQVCLVDLWCAQCCPLCILFSPVCFPLTYKEVQNQKPIWIFNISFHPWIFFFSEPLILITKSLWAWKCNFSSFKLLGM